MAWVTSVCLEKGRQVDLPLQVDVEDRIDGMGREVRASG